MRGEELLFELNDGVGQLEKVAIVDDHLVDVAEQAVVDHRGVHVLIVGYEGGESAVATAHHPDEQVGTAHVGVVDLELDMGHGVGRLATYYIIAHGERIFTALADEHARLSELSLR